MPRLLGPLAVIVAILAAVVAIPPAGASRSGPAAMSQETVTPTPDFASPADQTPTPAETRVPYELAVHPDRRKVAWAVRDGFRVRTLCAGGCELLEVQVYISPLTAREVGLRRPDGSRYTEEVLVASAPSQRYAEGRRIMLVAFIKKFLRRLSRAKRLRIAVEAQATDAAGATRTAVKRLTLRR